LRPACPRSKLEDKQRPIARSRRSTSRGKIGGLLLKLHNQILLYSDTKKGKEAKRSFLKADFRVVY